MLKFQFFIIECVFFTTFFNNVMSFKNVTTKMRHFNINFTIFMKNTSLQNNSSDEIKVKKQLFKWNGTDSTDRPPLASRNESFNIVIRTGSPTTPTPKPTRTVNNVLSFKNFTKKMRHFNINLNKNTSLVKNTSLQNNSSDEIEVKKLLKSNGTDSTDESSLDKGNDSISDIETRRQYGFNQKPPVKDHLIREIGMYEPYWKSGEWVYNRTTLITKRPKYTTFYDKRHATTPNLPIWCERTCSHYLKKYGQVCAHHFDLYNWVNVYKNFDNICEVDRFNCADRLKRPMWRPMHRGPCPELEPFLETASEPPILIAQKKKYDPYVYVPPPITKGG